MTVVEKQGESYERDGPTGPAISRAGEGPVRAPRALRRTLASIFTQGADGCPSYEPD